MISYFHWNMLKNSNFNFIRLHRLSIFCERHARMFRSRLYFAIINYINSLTARFEISVVTWSSVAPGNNNVPGSRAHVYLYQALCASNFGTMLTSFPFSFNPLMTIWNVWTLQIIYINQYAFMIIAPATVKHRICEQGHSMLRSLLRERERGRGRKRERERKKGIWLK